jgi:hypothetical protein
MSTMLPVRAFNRSQRLGIGGKDLRSSATTLVNLDNKRVQRDIARHSTLGGFMPVGPAFFQDDKGTVEYGGTVAVRATTLVVDVAAGAGYRNDTGAAFSWAVGTATVGAADATNPRIDIVGVNVTNGALSVTAGTATAGASLTLTRPGAASTYLAGVAAVPANIVALAYILVPATATTLLQANVLDVRP